MPSRGSSARRFLMVSVAITTAALLPPRFWEPVVPTFQSAYDLDAHSAVLDIGCAKGLCCMTFSD